MNDLRFWRRCGGSWHDRKDHPDLPLWLVSRAHPRLRAISFLIGFSNVHTKWSLRVLRISISLSLFLLNITSRYSLSRLQKNCHLVAQKVSARINMADFEYMNATEATEDTGPKLPLDLSHHYSRVTTARQASSTKSVYKYFQIPGIANLAGGTFNSIHSFQKWGNNDSCNTKVRAYWNNLHRSTKCQFISIRYPRSSDRTTRTMEAIPEFT